MNPAHNKASIFKAYDIRGRYPEEINEESVVEIVKGLITHFKKGKIVIAHDVRLSSPSLYKIALHSLKIAAAAAGSRRGGKNCKLKIEAVGFATTPMLYFLVNRLKARGGIMITASHNPKEFNGLKIVGPKAKPISGKEILALLKQV